MKEPSKTENSFFRFLSSPLQTLKAQAELQRQREEVSRVQEERCVVQRKYEDKCGELLSFLRKYEERGKELDEAKIHLQAERLGNR